MYRTMRLLFGVAALVATVVCGSGSVSAETTAAPFRLAANTPSFDFSQTATGKAQQQDKRVDLSPLLKYVGKSVVDKDYKSVWDDPLFKQALTETIGSDKVHLVYETWLAEEGVVEGGPLREGAILFLNTGKKHSGLNNRLAVFINLQELPDVPPYTIQACLREKSDNAKHATVTWYETGSKPRVLPSNACIRMKHMTILSTYGRGFSGLGDQMENAFRQTVPIQRTK